MKIKNQKNVKALIIIAFVLTTNLIIAQSTLVQQESQKIIGTWKIDNETANKWIFTANNTCTWEFNSTVIDQFTYSLSSEFSPSGLEHTYLKLININNSNEVFEYAINSLGDSKMTLETLTPKLSYTHFTKQ